MVVAGVVVGGVFVIVIVEVVVPAGGFGVVSVFADAVTTRTRGLPFVSVTASGSMRPGANVTSGRIV